MFIACPPSPLLTHSDTGGRLISSHESWGLIHGRWLPKGNTHLLGATSIWGQQRDSKIERYSFLTLMWKDRLKDRAVFIWIEPTGFPLRDKRVAITFGACYLSPHSWLFHWHPPLPNELFTDQIFSLLMSGGNSGGCWVAQVGWCSDSESCALQHREPVNFRWEPHLLSSMPVGKNEWVSVPRPTAEFVSQINFFLVSNRNPGGKILLILKGWK